MKKGYEFIDKSAYFHDGKILAIADLHIGYEEALNQAGIFIPRIQFSEMISELDRIFKKIGKIKEIVICGDLKHEFGTISQQEWDETFKLIDYLKENCEKIILVRGNHDKILGRLSERIEIHDCYLKNKICFIHGDKDFLFGKKQNTIEKDKKIKVIIIGHRHPAVIIADKYKKERYKCFLVGRYKRKEIIILPSFFPLVEGSDIINPEENKLFIPESKLRNFSVYVVADKTYNFGKLRRIGRLEDA